MHNGRSLQLKPTSPGLSGLQSQPADSGQRQRTATADSDSGQRTANSLSSNPSQFRLLGNYHKIEEINATFKLD